MVRSITNLNRVVFIFLLMTISSFAISAQSAFKGFGYKGGFQFNGAIANTEFESDNGMALKSYILKGFLRFELSNYWQLEINGGYGRLIGDGGNYYPPSSYYKTAIIPIELRALYTPFDLENWNPYFYLGFGALNYYVLDQPAAKSPNTVDGSGMTGVIPIGIGTEIKLSNSVALDVSAGYNLSLTDNLNYYKIKTMTDGYISFGLGLSFSGKSNKPIEKSEGVAKQPVVAPAPAPAPPKPEPVKVEAPAPPPAPKVEAPKPPVEKELTFDFVHFDFNKFALTKENKDILDHAYDVISKYNEPKVVLSGNTDSKGSEKYNMKLSKKRALIVKDYLVKKGLDEKCISIEIFGKTKPVVLNDTDQDRAKNRRTEITAKVMVKN